MVEACKGALCNVMVKCLTQGLEQYAIIRWFWAKRMLGLSDYHCQMGKHDCGRDERPAVATGSNDCQTNLAIPLDKEGADNSKQLDTSLSFDPSSHRR